MEKRPSRDALLFCALLVVALGAETKFHVLSKPDSCTSSAQRSQKGDVTTLLPPHRCHRCDAALFQATSYIFISQDLLQDSTRLRA